MGVTVNTEINKLQYKHVSSNKWLRPSAAYITGPHKSLITQL